MDPGMRRRPLDSMMRRDLIDRLDALDGAEPQNGLGLTSEQRAWLRLHLWKEMAFRGAPMDDAFDEIRTWAARYDVPARAEDTARTLFRRLFMAASDQIDSLPEPEKVRAVGAVKRWDEARPEPAAAQ